MRENQQFTRGIGLFNARKFFEAHEAWEELWLAESGAQKTFLQGLIQLAAAFHHHARGNPSGTESLLAAGLAKLAPFPGEFRGIQLAKLRRDARTWKELQDQDREPKRSSYPLIQRAARDSGKTKRGRP